MNSLQRISTQVWLKIALFNLLLVGILGLTMRLKMILPLPWINQKFLLHAHSHFAFAGWVTHALMALVLIVLSKSLKESPGGRQSMSPRAQYLVLANLLTSYGMLGTFLVQGYALYSITFSTLSIVVSYFFAAHIWKLTKSQQEHQSRTMVNHWFRAAVLLLVFSSLGTFVLSYLMATHNIDARKQLAAVYFYLHFQYNGWFLFACFGLFHHWLQQHGIHLKRAGTLFRVFTAASLPTYFLSVLWWKDMPDWLYWLVVFLTIAQLMAWTYWFMEVMGRRKEFKAVSSILVRVIWLVVGLALCIKLLLQALSLFPDLSQLAYGYRPIVIGYLHLVLLVIVSLFILAYAFSDKHLIENKLSKVGMYLSLIGILLNEVILMVQGLSGMLRIYVDHTHQSLVVASAMICMGMVLALMGQFKNRSIPKSL